VTEAGGGHGGLVDHPPGGGYIEQRVGGLFRIIGTTTSTGALVANTEPDFHDRGTCLFNLVHLRHVLRSLA
jgi:hypothetical protein